MLVILPSVSSLSQTHGIKTEWLWNNQIMLIFPSMHNHLVVLVVKESAARPEDPGFASCLRWDISGLSHASDLKTVTPVATLPGAWRYRVSAGTGQPVSVYCDWVK